MSKKPAAAVEASPPLWPWMLIAALVILIAFLLRLGTGADDAGSRDPLTAGNGATVNGALEAGGYAEQEGNAAWTHSATPPGSGQAAYADTAGGAGPASPSGGVSGWFSRVFGSDSASPTSVSMPGSTAAAISAGRAAMRKRPVPVWRRPTRIPPQRQPPPPAPRRCANSRTNSGCSPATTPPT